MTGCVRGDLEVELDVILQVLADAGPVGDEVDAVGGKFGAGTDAGELQELRRIDRPARHDHFAPRAH